MKISAEQWSQLRHAAFDDDPKRFEALVSQFVRETIREHEQVKRGTHPGLMPDGRPWLASAR